MPNTFNRLMKNVRVHCPGATDAGIKHELFDAMVEFCNETNYWWEDLTISVVANTSTYPLLCTQGNIVRLVSLRDSNNNPISSGMPVLGTLQLAYTPTTATTLTARVAKVPYISVGGYPDMPSDSMVQYSNIITDGIIGRLMMQINKPWTNPDISRYHLNRFRSGLNTIRAAVSKQNTYGTNSWTFPRGWTGRSQKFGIPSFGGSNTTF